MIAADKSRNIIEIITPYILAALIACFVYGLIETVFHPIIISGNSMSPTYYDGEILRSVPLSDEIFIEYGDVVVCYNGFEQLIKRVVALPGDSLYVKDGVLYVSSATDGSGLYLVSEYKYDDITDPGCLDKAITLADDEYFCMGDNRNHSVDSRIIGPIHRDQIKCIVRDKIEFN